jgi:hypothetical protein
MHNEETSRGNTRQIHAISHLVNFLFLKIDFFKNLFQSIKLKKQKEFEINLR